ncbi:PIG-L family deacetylase [Streptomyces sp. NBC_00882]|uniref:PIG-L deacetylase family protein n=1 Tax=Streptomyces TaxID=1883 RepID=UPI0038655FDA|nr:PIG-L family deacetylase [Streptomyces sp. NBC_00882]WSZ63816.1 PIG-L family deacetylase [Streptomyces canus]
MKNVLVVVAHPDDAEIGMGMRIAWYARNGARVRVHCLTTGTPEPNGAQPRRQEAASAGRVLGVAHYTFSEIPDTRFVEHRGSINADLFSVMRESVPDVVYTHFPGDQHIDHVTTSREVTAVALREAMNLCYFRSPYSTDFEPNLFFMGTEDLMEAKMKALDCFSSQKQLDMDVFRRIASVAYRQHVHHRIVERFAPELEYAEMFQTARRIEWATKALPA